MPHINFRHPEEAERRLEGRIAGMPALAASGELRHAARQSISGNRGIRMDTLETRLAARPRHVSPEEWAVRIDLAACYRLLHHFGWDDLVLTHNSARVPGTTDQILINPMGLMFDEVTASNLLKVDLEGKM